MKEENEKVLYGRMDELIAEGCPKRWVHSILRQEEAIEDFQKALEGHYAPGATLTVRELARWFNVEPKYIGVFVWSVCNEEFLSADAVIDPHQVRVKTAWQFWLDGNIEGISAEEACSQPVYAEVA